MGSWFCEFCKSVVCKFLHYLGLQFSQKSKLPWWVKLAQVNANQNFLAVNLGLFFKCWAPYAAVEATVVEATNQLKYVMYNWVSSVPYSGWRRAAATNTSWKTVFTLLIKRGSTFSERVPSIFKKSNQLFHSQSKLLALLYIAPPTRPMSRSTTSPTSAA